MARTISEIKTAMTKQFMADETVREKYGLSDDATFSGSFSAISIESILFHLFASCAWVIEKLIDTHKAEITEMVAEEMPHTLTWYQAKAKAFRYGQGLIADSDEYDDTDLTDEDIEAMKVVKRAACVESDGGVIVKVATTSGDDVTPLSAEQLTAFTSYMGEVRDAGVKTTIISADPDKLRLNLIVRVDGSVIDQSGTSISTGEEVIKDAINTYLGNLPFNGELIIASLVDALLAVDGVKVPHVSSASVASMETGGYGDYSAIEISHIPYSGYYTLDELNLTIQ